MATRSNTFILKRSNVVNKIPVLSGLTLGEIALNTADAKLYTLYTGGATGATEVRQIGWDKVDTFVTGFTYNNQNKLTISQNNDQPDLNVYLNTFSGLTINNGFGFYSFGTGWTQNQTIAYISASTGNVLVTKEWVESLSVDTSSSVAVNVATTAALPACTYNNGVSGVGATLTRNSSGTTGTIDGITVGLGDRILVKNQTSQLQNGVYEVTVVGNATTAFVLTRTTDSDETSEFDPQIVISTTGTQAGLRFAQTTADPVVGTSNIVYSSVGSSFVTQTATGTQTSGNIPFWTTAARELSKGSNTQLFWDNTNKRLGVGIGSPTSTVDVSGKTKTINFQMTSGATNNYVLKSDASGNASWVSITSLGAITGFTDYYVTGGTYSNGTLTLNRQNGIITVTGFTTGGGGGTFTGNTLATCITDLYISNLYGCSPITVWSSIQSTGNTASGLFSIAFGDTNVVSGNYSHAEGGGNVVSGDYAHAEGSGNNVWNAGAHAEGVGNYSLADGSHTEGSTTTTYGPYSHAEGTGTVTYGNYSHAEGNNTKSIGDNSHTEGGYTSTGVRGFYSPDAGFTTPGTIVIDSFYADISSQFSVGSQIILNDSTQGNVYGLKNFIVSSAYFSSPNTIIVLTNSTVSTPSGANIGIPGVAVPPTSFVSIGGNYSHTEGSGTITYGQYSHAEGSGTITYGIYSHAEGQDTITYGGISHAEGYATKTYGDYSHAEGNNVTSATQDSHAEGKSSSTGLVGYVSNDAGVSTGGTIVINSTYGNVSAEFTSGFIMLDDSGYSNIYGIQRFDVSSVIWDGTYTKVFLVDTTVSATTGANIGIPGNGIPYLADQAIGGKGQHSEGEGSLSIGQYSHGEGFYTITYGDYSHAEGEYTETHGSYSHAEGTYTKTYGSYSHAEGSGTITYGQYSHAEGSGSKTYGQQSHAGGSYSIASGTTSFIHSTNSLVIGDRSAVLGGQNITGSSVDTVYVPYLNLNYIPTYDKANTQILNRNSSTGNVEYMNLSDIVVGGGSSGDTYVTGFTYNNSNKLTISQNGGQTDLNVYLNTFSGLTVNGGVNVSNGLTANTISTTLKNSLFLLTTPQNDNTATQILTRNITTGVVEYRDTTSLPDYYVTGGTYSAGTITLNRQNGSATVTGLPRVKAGSVSSGSFVGTPKKATVTFTSNYPSTSYVILLTGGDNRVFTYESQTVSGFTINTNSNTVLSNNVYWQTTPIGEY